MARALDRIAGQLGSAAGTADQETERLSEQLARTSELRDQIDELQRTIEALDREARQGQQGGRPESDAQGQRGQSGQQPGQQSQSGQQGQQGQQPGQEAGQSGSKSSQSSSPQQGQAGREGSTGEQGGADGGRGGQLARLQREASDRMREAQRTAGELRQQNPDMRNSPATPEDWYPSLSAPGTESFKQDFSKWESLKKNLLMALERTESRLASQLRERESRERLNVGGHQGVSDEYREMVDRYYQSLASPRKPPR